MTRGPLSRQGIGPAEAYEQARAQREADRRKLEQITRDSEHIAADSKSFGTPPAGDERTLRGIPAIGRNVAGAIPGTNPVSALIHKCPRR